MCRVKAHITTRANFNQAQSANRQNFSTETALLATFNDIYRAVDEGCSTVLVALDISAAFDTIEHSILINRLRDGFGIDGLVLSLIESYLNGRQHWVKFGSAWSLPALCDCGSHRDRSLDHSCSQLSSRQLPGLLTDTTSRSVNMLTTLKCI